MGQVTTSVTINFGGSAGSNVFNAEVDSRPEGYNKGSTNFFPGDTAYLLLYKTTNVTKVRAFPSSGSVSSAGSATVEKKETVTLTNSREFSTSAPVTGSYSINWYGNQPAGLVKTGENTFAAAENTVAVGEITYQTTADVYALSNVQYPAAVVVFTGETP